MYIEVSVFVLSQAWTRQSYRTHGFLATFLNNRMSLCTERGRLGLKLEFAIDPRRC